MVVLLIASIMDHSFFYQAFQGKSGTAETHSVPSYLDMQKTFILG
jgi:hypothetical protein